MMIRTLVFLYVSLFVVSAFIQRGPTLLVQ
jgi:hypothetical protein